MKNQMLALAVSAALAAHSAAAAVVTVDSDRTITGSDSFDSSTVFEVKAGATLDMASIAMTIAGVTGSGSIVNAALTLTCEGGPYKFSGTMSGTLTFSKPAGVSDDEFKFIAGASNTLADVTYTEPNVDCGVIAFSPGVGTFRISTGTSRAHICAAKQPLNLEDLNGDPVTVFAALQEGTATKLKCTGCGDYYTTVRIGGGGVSLASVSGMSGGRFGPSANGWTLGGSPAANLAGLEGLALGAGGGSGASITMPNSDTKYISTVNIHGNGTISLRMPTELQASQIRQVPGETLTINYTKDLTIKNGVFFNNGGGRTIAPSAAGVVLTLDDAAVASYENSKVLFPGLIRNDSNSHYSWQAHVLTNGAVYGGSDYLAATVTVHKGSAYYQSNGSGTAVRRLEGGTLGVIAGQTMDWPNADTEILIGEEGGVLEGIQRGTMNNSSIGITIVGRIRTADGIAQDGGVTQTGSQDWHYKRPLEIKGPFRFQDGLAAIASSTTASAGDDFFGTGDFVFGDGYLANLSSLTPVKLAGGTGARMVVDGSAALLVAAGQDWTIGPAGAADSPLVRSQGLGGFLVLHYAGSACLPGTAAFVKVNGGVEKRTSGLTKAPTALCDTSVSKGTVSFAAYDDENGFVPFAGAASDFSGGAESVVRLTSETTLSESAAAAALDLHSTKLTIGEGATLSIGEGDDPAPVLLDHSAYASTYGIVGGGTLDFGSREAAFLLSSPYSRGGHPKLSARITGSGGVSYHGVYPGIQNGYWEAVELYGTNTYSGGTRFCATAAYVNSPAVFGSGQVRVDGGAFRGSRLIFNKPGMTITNDIVVSGYGGTHFNGFGTLLGVLNFPEDTTIAANVAVEGQAAFGTFEKTGASIGTPRGVISGVISGGMVTIASGPGSIVMTAQNTYSGRTAVYGKLVLAGESPRAGTKDIILCGDGSATLRFENAAPLSVPNRIVGIGRIELAGAPVAFADATCFKGVIDLCGGDRAVEMSVEKITEITNSVAGTTATLTIAGSGARRTEDRQRRDGGSESRPLQDRPREL